MGWLKKLTGTFGVKSGQKNYTLTVIQLLIVGLNLFKLIDDDTALKAITFVGTGQVGAVVHRVVRGPS